LCVLPRLLRDAVPVAQEGHTHLALALVPGGITDPFGCHFSFEDEAISIEAGMLLYEVAEAVTGGGDACCSGNASTEDISGFVLRCSEGRWPFCFLRLYIY